jgi:hypothetical protein
MLAMSKTEGKTKLVGPWRTFQVAIWLVGLAVLAWTGKWWPGILVLLAVSVVYEALLRRFAPTAFVPEEPEKPEALKEPETSPDAAPMAAPVQNPPPPLVPQHRAELLPSECPKCGGPIRIQEVTWTGVQSADCPYCGANLPMEKEVASG